MSNPSGVIPTEFKVLVEPREPVKQIGSIILADETTEKDKWATTEGRIVAISPLAFTYVTEAEWGGHKPQVGARVIFTQYAGKRLLGKNTKDGKDYIILPDKDVLATIEE